MKYLKLFEEHNNNTEKHIKEKEIKYVVKFDLVEGSSDPIEVEEFSNLEKAENYFNSTYEYEEGKYKTWEHFKTLDKVIYNVSYSYDTEWEDKEDIDDSDKEWEIEDWENINYESYSINTKSDKLLEDIEDWFKNEYNSRNYKYHNINIEYFDENGEEKEKTIQVRFSDHTENIHNIDRYGRPDYHISIVISNYDTTGDKFWSNPLERLSTEYELKYNSEDNIEEIKNDISNLIEEIKFKIKNQF